MIAVNYVVQEISPATEPSDAELAELARLRKRFRLHRIFRDVTHARGVRYVAHGATITVRPHTIINHDLAELHDELEQAALDELSAPPQIVSAPACAGTARASAQAKDLSNDVSVSLCPLASQVVTACPMPGPEGELCQHRPRPVLRILVLHPTAPLRVLPEPGDNRRQNLIGLGEVILGAQPLIEGTS